MQRRRNGRSVETRYGEGIRNPRARQRALLIAVGPDEPDLAELKELLRTARVAVAGESQIETDRRLARDRIAALRRRLERTRGSRSTMRQERERAHLPTVALAGYTNAGKSTLLNALTGADAGIEDRLFHTLDPMTRSFEIAGRPYLLIDTVGFIRKLPHQLVDAFAATLEETLRADLIVHVADASAPEDELLAMIDAVEEVLAEIGAGDKPRLLALNKVDLVDEERRRELTFRH